MNKERMLELADYIEKSPHILDMERWYTPSPLMGKSDALQKRPFWKFIKQSHEIDPCGTSCCIAGEALFLIDEHEQVRDPVLGSVNFERTAARWLDLTDIQADILFCFQAHRRFGGRYADLESQEGRKDLALEVLKFYAELWSDGSEEV